MTSPVTLPVPPVVESIRDGDGRLVGMTMNYGLDAVAAKSNAWLVAVDGSAHGLRAVTEAIHLAANMNACALHVVNVQHWLSREAAETELSHRALAATETACALLRQAARPWRLHVAMGDPAERIVALAKELGCRGIVIGSRGLGSAETLLMGSVAYKVIHLSAVPVMVVR
jgi:nucleotide-binding universal stress UspA family protein